MKRKTYNILFLTVWAIFLAIFIYTEFTGEMNMVEEMSVSQATEVLYKLDELMEWNLSFDRVFVDVGKHTPDHLKIPAGKDKTNDGEELSQILFPTFLTQISSIKIREHGVKTHISSLKALNPMNEPDAWERTALETLERGVADYSAFEKDKEGHTFFKYMKPVYIEAMCLDCHVEQDYRIGDIRAGITAILPVDDLLKGAISHTWQVVSIAILLWLMGLCIAVILNRHHVRERSRIRELTEMSLHDELTSLYNRRGFLMIAQKNVKLIKRMEGVAVIFFFDLDRFKEVNDTYGHPAGDEVLQRMAKVLNNTFRESDVVARFGGDEFIAMAMDCQPGCSDDVIGRLHEQVRESNIRARTFYELSVSVGVSLFDPDESRSIEEVILEADELMYENKERKKTV